MKINGLWLWLAKIARIEWQNIAYLLLKNVLSPASFQMILQDKNCRVVFNKIWTRIIRVEDEQADP